jgi:hypothetical protein
MAKTRSGIFGPNFSTTGFARTLFSVMLSELPQKLFDEEENTKEYPHRYHCMTCHQVLLAEVNAHVVPT